MPKAEGPVYREILHASAKLNGKPVRWIVGVFANEAMLRSFKATLDLSYKSNAVEYIKAMDVHSPAKEDSDKLTDIKFVRQQIQYNPQTPGLDDDAALV